MFWCAKLKVGKTEFKFDPTELKSVQWYNVDEFLESKRVTDLKPQRVAILRQMVTDFPGVKWVDDVAEKRFLRCNPASNKKKNPHDRDARSLVKLLRHDLDSQKIRYDPAGYVTVQDVIKSMKKLTFVTIQEIVEYTTTSTTNKGST